MGIYVQAHLVYGVDIGVNPILGYTDDDNEEGWIEAFYEKEDHRIQLFTYGNYDTFEQCHIITMDGLYTTSDLWRSVPASLDVSSILKQILNQWLQDHDIKDKPEWVLCASMG